MMIDPAVLAFARDNLSWSLTNETFAPIRIEHLGVFVMGAKRGVELAHRGLCQFARQLIGADRPLPKELQEYLLWAAEQYQPPKRRGGDGQKYVQRDYGIVSSVDFLVRRGSLHPTRNREQKSERPSACSIVADLMKELGVPMTEASVESIWIAASKRGDVQRLKSVRNE